CSARTCGHRTGKGPRTLLKYTSIVCALSCRRGAKSRSSTPFGAGAMLFERFKKLQATIRFRIMLWMIVVVLLLVTLAMLGVRQIYGTRLLDDFDKSLRADVDPVAKEIRESYPDWARIEQNITRIALAHPLQAWFAEVYDVAGRKVVAGGFKDFTPPLK